MRTGLLTRFWGSLGMALGAVSFIFFQFALLWFVYLALLLLGRVPGGRPPAWESRGSGALAFAGGESRRRPTHRRLRIRKSPRIPQTPRSHRPASASSATRP